MGQVPGRSISGVLSSTAEARRFDSANPSSGDREPKIERRVARSVVKEMSIGEEIMEAV